VASPEGSAAQAPSVVSLLALAQQRVAGVRVDVFVGEIDEGLDVREHFDEPSAQFAERLGLVRQQYEAFQQKARQAALKPTDWKNRIDVASEYNIRRGFGQAETQLVKLLNEKSAPPDIRDQAYYQLAVSQFSQKKYDASIKTLQKFSSVQQKGPTFEQSRLLLGQIYIDQGKYKSALGEFRSFKRNYPTSPLTKNVEMILSQLEKAVADGQ